MKNAPIVLTIVVAAFLTACAAPSVDRSAFNFNETKYSLDLNFCRGGNVTEATLKTIGLGALGSLVGAGVVATYGAAAAGSVEAVAVGAAVGAVIGLGYGANQAVEKHQQEIADCLREKGYVVVAYAD